MTHPLNLLLVEDNSDDAQLVLAELRSAGFDPQARVVASEADYLAALDPALDVIVSDYRLSNFDGKRALDLLKARGQDIPFILISGAIGEELAVQLMREGAADFLLKGRLARLGPTVASLVEQKRLRSLERHVLADTRQLAAIVESSVDAMFSSSTHGRILSWNPAAQRLFGYTAAEAIGRDDFMLVPPAQRDQVQSNFERLRRGVPLAPFETVRLHKDGTEVAVSVSAAAIKGPADAITSIAIVIRDITTAKLLQQKLENLSRIRTLSSRINALIVRVREPQTLFAATCQIAVEHGGFGIAWIGMVGQNNIDVVPAACAGFEAESLMTTSHNSARLDTPLGQGIVGRAIKGKCAVASNNLATEPGTGGARRKEALRRGYHSIIALPLVVGDKAVGNLSLFASGVNFFDTEEVVLLTELAANVSFALDSIRKAEALADSEKIQREHYALARLLGALAATANEAVSVEAAFQSSLRLISEYGGWRLGHLVTFAPDTADQYRVTASLWQVEDRARFAEFMEICERADYLIGKRLVGRAIAEKIPVWIEDLAVFGSHRRFGSAVAAGLHCAFAFPVIVQNEVAAVLEFYAEGVRGADASLIESVTNIAAQLARVIERARASEGQARLSVIVESSQDAILSTAPDGTILTWNTGAEKLFGYTCEEIIGEKLALLIPDELRQDAQRIMQIFLSGNNLAAYESERLTKDQRRIAMSISGSFIKDQMGKIVGTAIIYRNITARKEIERTRAQLAAIVESSDDAIISRAPDDKIISWNSAAARLFGWSVEEALGQPFRRLLRRGSSLTLRQRFEKVLRGESCSQFDDARIAKDGTRIDVQTTMSAVRNEHGAVMFVACIMRDIRERLAGEAQLRASNQQLALLVNSSPLAIYARDRDGLVTSWNPAAEKMFGWTAAEVLGKMLPSVPEEERAQSNARRLRILASETFIRNEARRRRKDGSLIDIDANLGPLRDAAGDIIGVIAVVADVTARKQAENERAGLASIVENANVGIFSRALDGKILTWNRGAEKMLGYSAADVIGKSTLLMLPTGRPRNLARNNEDVFRGNVVARESDRLTKDGRVINVLTSHSPIHDGGGNIVGASVILQDITEHKQAQDALRASEERLRELTQRLIEVQESERRNINRELHDRAGQSLALLNLMLSTIGAQLEQGSREMLRTRIDAAQKLLSSVAAEVRDVMADLRPAALDEYGLYAGLREHASQLGLRTGLTVELHGADLQRPLSPTQETMLFRVAQEALSNASRHANAAHVTLVLTQNSGGVTLSITDDGSGFDTTNLKSRQAHWGMGIMRERAEAVGAAMRIESTPGRGTRVVVEVPGSGA